MKNNKTEIIGSRVTKNELDAIKKMANLHGLAGAFEKKFTVSKKIGGENRHLRLKTRLASNKNRLLNRLRYKKSIKVVKND